MLGYLSADIICFEKRTVSENQVARGKLSTLRKIFGHVTLLNQSRERKYLMDYTLYSVVYIVLFKNCSLGQILITPLKYTSCSI